MLIDDQKMLNDDQKILNDAPQRFNDGPQRFNDGPKRFNIKACDWLVTDLYENIERIHRECTEITSRNEREYRAFEKNY
jgi:hypothetical protein